MTSPVLARRHCGAVRSLGLAIVIATLPASLGIWQLRRLESKEALLAQLDASAAAAPSKLNDQSPAFSRVLSFGEWDTDRNVFYGMEEREIDGRVVLGHHLIGIWRRPQADAVLVDRGWLPNGVPIPVSKATSLIGFVMSSERPGPLTAPDRPMLRQYYVLNPIKIGHDLGLHQVTSFFVIETDHAGMDYPIEPADLPRPPNNHLNYAITWFGLTALVLSFPVIRLYKRTSSRR